MRFEWTALIAALALVGCDDGGNASPEQEGPADSGVDAAVDMAEADAAPPAPSCATNALYDPANGEEGIFPDDAWTIADDSTTTGLRIQLDDSNAPWLADVPAGYRDIFTSLNELDGWGTNAEILLRFDAPIVRFEGMHPSVKIYDLGGDAPVEIAYRTGLYDSGTRLGLTPIHPLRPSTPHAVVITNDLPTEEGGCLGASPTLRTLLDGSNTEPSLQPLMPRYAALAEALDAEPSTWAHAGLFTTQNVFESSQVIAADIADATYRWNDDLDCRQSGMRRICTRTFAAGDYRVDGVTQPPPTRRSYRLVVHMVLPDAEGPHPVVFCGHGLSDSSNFCSNAIGYFDEPVVVVAIDAPHHGAHPAGAPDNPALLLQDFFAVDILGKRIEALKLRDNFRTATFDKLQLLRLLRLDPDLNGDGDPDVNVERMAYFGMSLGGIMASEFLALADGITAAHLNVPGARLTQIIRDARNFAPLVQVLIPNTQSTGQTARIFSAAQTVLEPGEPANWATRVTRDRLVGEPAHVLLTMAIDDMVVPNSSTRTLAVSLGVPLVPPVVEAWDDMAVAEGPVEGNLDGLTGGLVQFEQVTTAGGMQDASHNNTAFSAEVLNLAQRFFAGWRAGETPRIE
jgi:hypothetical protein